MSTQHRAYHRGVQTLRSWQVVVEDAPPCMSLNEWQLWLSGARACVRQDLIHCCEDCASTYKAQMEQSGLCRPVEMAARVESILHVLKHSV